MAEMRDWFKPWLTEHFDLGRGDILEGTCDPSIFCKRCDMKVVYPTKHAHNVHGDQVDILPNAQGYITDHEGRLVDAHQD